MSIVTDDPEMKACIDQLDVYLHEAMIEHHFPSFAIGIMHDQDVVLSSAYGYADHEKKVPATSHTIYALGSITKLFTATLLLQMRDAGKVNLDDPLTAYLPELKIVSAFGEVRPPTFRQTVAHIAGFPNFSEGSLRQEKDVVIAPLLEEMFTPKLVIPPMTEHRYSNLGISLMGHALARISGQSYEEMVQTHILDPLGMKMTAFSIRDEMRPYLATGYVASHGSERSQKIAPYFEAGGMKPAGGLYSSIEDMERFIALQFRTESTGSSVDVPILDGRSIREMHSPTFFLNQEWRNAIGLGWFLERLGKYTIVGHDGGIFGFGSDLLLVPALKLGMILLTNVGSPVNGVSRGVLERLLPVFERYQLRQQEDGERALAPIPLDWQCYEGAYTELNLTQTLRILFTPTMLKVQAPDGSESRLEKEGEQSFRGRGGPLDGELFTFCKHETGIVESLKVSLFEFVRTQ
ncbi:serine hydrolase domain-containing protein [Tengunoibacter tsumagoiensis]|uniref:Beta-lactamase-related domain-containing protein n=1 Tax=Tengunoibacter tsumagoiensis TaxID=2014871 RepID=A0A402A2K2_9CHLR|nr:serine hydrolase domain-containing protein [Tengunoibacter tsumagoiensis]GCE13377.1 hypothetical protein KTT_32360 [Tengunoibacter tsumagoiensis]